LGLAKESIGAQLGAQLISVTFTIVYSGVLSFLILKVVDVLVGLRVNEDEESQGLDLALHSEQGYNMEL
jgi:Amt family ammonium transporter